MPLKLFLNVVQTQTLERFELQLTSVDLLEHSTLLSLELFEEHHDFRCDLSRSNKLTNGLFDGMLSFSSDFGLILSLFSVI